MSMTRRSLLAASGAALVATGAQAQTASGSGDAAASALLAQTAEALLIEYPESAAALGLDKEARAGLKGRLTDRSIAGNRARAATCAQRLEALRALDKTHLSPTVALNVAVTEEAHALAEAGYSHFPYGDVALLDLQWAYRSTPYVVSQGTGAFAEIPDLLDSNHGVETAADAEAYLSRLDAYAAALDGETERLKHDGGLGVIAPDFLLDKTLAQMRQYRAQPLETWGVVTSLQKRAAAKGLPPKFGDHAMRLTRHAVAPALDRQIAALAALRAKATSDAGVWKLPDGDAYYAWALRVGTTSRLSPDEVHKIGLEQTRDYAAQMDVLLRAEGLTQGSVGERFIALSKDPKYLYPDTDAGRAELLAYLNDRIADIRPRLPRAFGKLVKGNLVIKRVPPEIQAGMPGGYASAGSIDGKTPGIYYINLQDTNTWPKFDLPTLCYHEGIPGHVWQGEYTYDLPLIRTLITFNAYSEGWALYAEQLGDELGAYEHDALGKLGYLRSMHFRACRMVVDTGLHAKHWGREQAVQWFINANGSPEVRSEIDRYCAWPGQACGYKVGHNEINRLRAKAKAQLGPRFDLRAFDDAVVQGGGVPMTLLERVIDGYIAGRLA